MALAEFGANIIALVGCAEVDTIAYQLVRPSDLRETECLVQEAGSSCLRRAGVVSFARTWEMTDDEWSVVLG